MGGTGSLGAAHTGWARLDRAGEEPHGKGSMTLYENKTKTSRQPRAGGEQTPGLLTSSS